MDKETESKVAKQRSVADKVGKTLLSGEVEREVDNAVEPPREEAPASCDNAFKADNDVAAAAEGEDVDDDDDDEEEGIAAIAAAASIAAFWFPFDELDVDVVDVDEFDVAFILLTSIFALCSSLNF